MSLQYIIYYLTCFKCRKQRCSNFLTSHKMNKNTLSSNLYKNVWAHSERIALFCWSASAQFFCERNIASEYERKKRWERPSMNLTFIALAGWREKDLYSKFGLPFLMTLRLGKNLLLKDQWDYSFSLFSFMWIVSCRTFQLRPKIVPKSTKNLPILQLQNIF